MNTTAMSLPLLQAQAGAWYSQQLDPASSALNIGEFVHISGDLDPGLFETAVRTTVEETDALNVRFRIDGDDIRQTAVPRDARRWDFLHLDQPGPDAGQRAMDWMRADLARPVEIEDTWPMFGSALIRLGHGRHVWYLRYHQTVLDGYGWSLFARRVAEVYRALAQGTAPLRSSFAALRAVVDEERFYRASDDFAADRDWWRARAEAALADLERGPGKADLSASPHRRAIRISPGAAGRLGDIAENTGVRQGHFLMALMGIYHSRIAAEPVVVGVPVAARSGSAASRTPCKLSNVLPLAVPTSASWSLAEMVRALSGELAESLAHQRYRSEDLRHDLSMRAENGRFAGPLVNVVRFNFDLDFGSARGVVENLSTGPVEDMSMCVFDRRNGSGLQVVLEGNSSRYSTADMAMHERRISRFLSEVCACADGDKKVSAIPVLLPEEHRRLVAGWNETSDVFPADRCLHELFAEAARRSPTAVAVVAGPARVTYAELDLLASQLADVLSDAGVGPDVPVGLWIDRSASVIVALLAVLKAGGCYVPLDPDIPPARARQIVADAGAAVVLIGAGEQDKRKALADEAAAVLEVDGDGVAASHLEPLSPPAARPRPVPDNLVSIYYTSGSTGAPKGVASTHRGWVNRMWWMRQYHRLRPGEVVLHKTVLSFDDAAVEIFWPLLAGGTVAVLPPGLHRDPRAILDAAIEHRAAAVQFVPSVLEDFLDEMVPEDASPLKDLRHVVSSGEALRPAVVRKFFGRLGAAGCRLINQFGPTEVSIDATVHVCEADDGLAAEVPIGLPIANTRAYVLDRYLDPLPVGVTGELYLSGVGLARGYWKDPAKTADAFVPDQFGIGGRLYKTGDLVFRRPDGRLVFVGRSDHQVKIRGIRVEPAEIESVLADHEDVGSAVVVKWEPRPGDHRLAAYLTPARAGGPIAIADVRTFVAERLPVYSIPAAFTVLDTIPRTPAGKIDRRALPLPSSGPLPGDHVDADDTPPGTETEKVVARVWREVLAVESVGVHQDFFDLGGHSLLATKVVSRLRRAVGADLPLSLVFDHPTVASQATALSVVLERANGN